MVIDLGEVRDAPVADTPPPWSPRRRRAVAAVGAVVALLGAVGAAAPVRDTLVHVTIPAEPADGWFVDGDLLYLTGPEGPALRTVAVYRLPGASLLWRVTLPEGRSFRGVSPVEDSLLAVSESEPMETIVLDAATGRVRWRRPGWSQPGGPGHLLFHEEQPGGSHNRVASVALDTGVARWSLDLASEDWLQVEGDFMVRWTSTGLVEVRDVRTGAVRRSIRLTRDPASEHTTGIVVGDLLMHAGEGGDHSVVTAYGLERLDRRWQAKIDIANEFIMADCGGGLCVGGGMGGVRLVDAATGRTRWTAPKWTFVEQVGPYLIGTRPHGNPPDRAVLDPDTGREVRDLGRWETGRPDGEGRSLGLQTDPRTGTTWVAWLDPGTGRPRILGVLKDVFSCQAGDWTVVCRHVGGAIGVWYFRRKLEP